MKNQFKYNSFTRILRVLWRRLFPVAVSPYTLGKVKDICEVELVPRKTLANFFDRALNILQGVRENTGDYLEFGVFNGSSISSMYHTARTRDLQMNFFGFDAFQGLPSESEDEDCGVWQQGFYTCSFEEMQGCLKGRDVDPDEIIWVKGWYQDTLNGDTIREHGIDDPGIIMIDCDTYSSTRTVLEVIANLIQRQPVILCFDDWKLYDLDVKGEGEYRAFNEFVEAHCNLFDFIEIRSYNRKSKSFLLTPRYGNTQISGFTKFMLWLEKMYGSLVLR